MVRSVLVVDDDAAVRGLIVRILRSRGHRVVGEAGTVAGALAAARALRPDVALVDVGLPDGNGFALAERLRSTPEGPEVLLFSSDADRTNETAARRVGALGFLPKEELSGPALDLLLGEPEPGPGHG